MFRLIELKRLNTHKIYVTKHIQYTYTQQYAYEALIFFSALRSIQCRESKRQLRSPHSFQFSMFANNNNWIRHIHKQVVCSVSWKFMSSSLIKLNFVNSNFQTAYCLHSFSLSISLCHALPCVSHTQILNARLTVCLFHWNPFWVN